MRGGAEHVVEVIRLSTNVSLVEDVECWKFGTPVLL